MEILKILPKNQISQWVGRAASIKNPSLFTNRLKNWFVKRYKINMSEAEYPIEHYSSLSDLFIRKLKSGVRPIGRGIVHPCDARITVCENISSDQLIQAKGRSYSLNEFIKDPQGQETFKGGKHIVYYLCPTDYHRVHAPIDAQVTEVIHVPGHLWPVNEWSVQNIDQLFAVNERVIFRLKTEGGPVALVMVGATNVGQISVSFDASIRTNQNQRLVNTKKYHPPIEIKKGDELGIFHMGSTVIMLYSPGVLAPPAKAFVSPPANTSTHTISNSSAQTKLSPSGLSGLLSPSGILNPLGPVRMGESLE